ncbi:MAG TPA: ABC transporter permease [bacterium]|nr:ABC transporter permease [bacterium]
MSTLDSLRNAGELSEPFFERMGKRFLSAMNVVGGVSSLARESVRCLFTFRLEIAELTRQLMMIGNRSFTIVALISLFTGLVMALQLAVGLGRFGLKLYVGQMVGLAIFRELGPVLTSLMVAARVGSSIAAELGSMVVTEQVLAIEAMGANPVQKLVVPRLLATIIATPLLTVMADVIGTLGGMVISVREAGVTPQFYIDQVTKTIILDDFVSGVAKAFFFGFFVAIISCYQGLMTTGGTEGVGRATTRAVVYSTITIFISDFFLTKLILYV